MANVRLFIGTGASWSETEVARLVDGTVEVGHGPSTIYPAHVDRDGTVCFGATWTYGPAQTVLGHVNEADRTVTEGMSRYADAIGSWDEDGRLRWSRLPPREGRPMRPAFRCGGSLSPAPLR